MRMTKYTNQKLTTLVGGEFCRGRAYGKNGEKLDTQKPRLCGVFVILFIYL